MNYDNPYIRDTLVLKDFQKVGVKKLLTSKILVLGDATGLGKTVQLLVAFAYYKKRYPNARLVILSRVSLLEQIEAEVYKFLTGIKAHTIINMTAKVRLETYKDFFDNGDVLIVNYETFRTDMLNPETLNIKIKTDHKIRKFPAKITYKDKLKGEWCVSQDGSVQFRTLPLVKLKKGLEKLTGGLRASFTFQDKDDKPCTYHIALSYKGGIYRLAMFDQDEKLLKETKTKVKLLPSYIAHCPHELFCVFDEAIYLKESTSGVHKSCAFLASKSDHKKAVSASITKGRLSEAYNIYKALGLSVTPTKKDFEKLFCTFEKNWFQKQSRYAKGTLTGFKNLQAFKQRIAPYYLGRAKKEVAAELPNFTIKHYHVDECKGVNQALTKIYREAQDLSDPVNIGRILIALTTPQVYIPELGEDYISSKVAEVIRVFNESYSGEKVLIYLDYKKPVEYLVKIFEKHLKDVYQNPLVITGGVTNRQELVDLFNTSDKHNLMIINSAGKEGLNLQVAGDLFYLTNPPTAGDYIQVCGRISRIGTKHTKLLIRKFAVRDSADTDSEFRLQVGLRLLQAVNPNSIDEGLLEESKLGKHVSLDDCDEPNEIILKKFEKRAKRYL